MQNDMRDRLVGLLDQRQDNGNYQTIGEKSITLEFVSNEKLADHLIANGVIVPPCKVGDKVYFISIYNKVEEYIVKGICQYPNGLFIEINYLGNSYSIPIDKAFRTREEAEQKLKEMRDENG